MLNIYEKGKTGRASFLTTGRPILGHQAQTSDTSNKRFLSSHSYTHQCPF